MPEAIFEDKDLIETIARETGYRPRIIIKKEINKDGNIAVFWK